MNSSGNNDVLLLGKDDFKDSGYWDELANKHLSSYTLPKWSVTCSVEAMTIWLERLGLESDYTRGTNTSVEDFMFLNPHWPLRAFIGLALEMKDEGK